MFHPLRHCLLAIAAAVGVVIAGPAIGCTFCSSDVHAEDAAPLK
jgi:hypothetical protein